MISIEEVKEQAAEAERKAREAKAEYEFAERHPELNCKANFDILRRVHDRHEVTLKSLEELSQHPQITGLLAVKNTKQIFHDEAEAREKQKVLEERAKQKARQQEDAEREKLIPQILSLLKVSDMMKEGERKKYLLKDAKGNFIVPIEQLRTRLQNLKDVSVWRGATTEQLKEHLQSKPKKQTTAYPPLPKDISASQIRLMWDATQLRNGIKRYGAVAITKRLQEGLEE